LKFSASVYIQNVNKDWAIFLQFIFGEASKLCICYAGSCRLY